MGTRGVIARKTDKGFTGVYHHWDSYPDGLGQTLFNLYNEQFKHDLKAMLKTLIDDHPAGWSTINGKDFSLEPGWVDTISSKVVVESLKPQCYCHGVRHEEGCVFDETNASGSGCEWAYVFDEIAKTMEVYASIISEETATNLNLPKGTKMIGAFGCGDEHGVWVRVYTVNLEKSAPIWNEITV